MKKISYLLVLGVLFWSCKESGETNETEQKEELESVSTVFPLQKTIQDDILASGVLSSKAELKLAFKTGGMIKRMYVKEGQYVKAGQLLAELDMSEIDAAVNQAKLGLEKAERDVARVKGMLEDEVATKNNLEDATTAFSLAKESVETAKFNQKLSRIYAPQAGKILMKISEQGELITPFVPAIILGTGGSSFNVKVGLADKDVVKVKIGDNAEVRLDAYASEVFPARVTEIAQMINPSTGTYEVELTLNSKGKKLISGFVAKSKITPQSERQVLMIPASALIEAENENAFVFVFNGQSVEKRKILIGGIHENQVEVLTGLSTADQVVTLGANFLSEGQNVKVVNL
ncbi:efflux RND transporter periplasmic adaptor subunit [Arcticibacterium luteifluviistationis]|uniref:Efflux RND transporter periplasmic adaptor subunit n=1 Tax=Arcticibacterium luteifluviistationis TaxID=1784714 RepID=A0A2Z4GEM9_9BACT|nr:efflux RND transporter periplasmic adaptor subunit [Arcticibacterium luteifluviistationis]AWV99789.1 efflux RND transporter periplasmic adaptor subunit [Arcticibacterium luteifluviistationis]